MVYFNFFNFCVVFILEFLNNQNTKIKIPLELTRIQAHLIIQKKRKLYKNKKKKKKNVYGW